jgi:2-polyprenyl-3-methyl-5-hydroxy-6-metoxy-1,4-benzoquinol methylase
LGKKRKQVFSIIYKENHWNDAESISGPGSTVQSTMSIGNTLPQIISKYKIKTLLDIPCGDFNWMHKIDLSQVSYTGMDIVPDLIKSNTMNFSGENRKFMVADLVEDKLPKSDLIFCRDCLVHLSFKDIHAALANMKRSQSIYLLTTSFTDHSNFDIVTGNWRQTNLQAPPFNLPPPVEIFNEGEGGDNKDKSMVLWRLQDLT